MKDTKTLKPTDYSDVGQATVLAREYRSVLRYSEQTDYIYFNGKYWEELKSSAQKVAQILTDRQLDEASQMLEDAKSKLEDSGGMTILSSTSNKKAEDLFNDSQLEAYKEYQDAKTYLSFVIKRRESKNITGTLKEARPMLYINIEELDNKPFLLNTPVGTYDLRLGSKGRKKHNPADLITKITSVSPSKKGWELWRDTLNLTFSCNQELIDYVQRILGLCVIGKVYFESVIIAYGDGRNGKSTFWNSVSKVLGSYSGSISADTLTVGCKRNVKPELAEAKGKRLLIAAELEEGSRLNTSTIKQLASTDEIFAEKKYKAPFKFEPSHTLILYTNHLPKVGATDDGIWRRLVVIPFNAHIEGEKDIKNYTDYLVKNAGEVILAWMILGAEKIIKENYKLTPPQVVVDAIGKYKENNHWLNQFIDDCCEKNETYKEKSGLLYTTYRDYCSLNGEYVRSTTDFYSAIELAGYKKIRDKTGRFIVGLKLKDASTDGLDIN